MTDVHAARIARPTMTHIRLRVGPIVLVACTGLYRAIWLSVQLTGFTFREVAILLLAELPVIGLLAIVAWIEPALSRPWRVVSMCVSVIVLAFYGADLVTVLFLNARLQISDILQFGPEVWLVGSYIGPALAAIAIGAASLFLTVPVPAVVVRLIPATALMSLAMPFLLPQDLIPSHIQKYTGSVLLLVKELTGSRTDPISRYRPGDIAAYNREYEALFDAPIARSGKDIVLVIAESLSASDSDRTSGVRTLLDGFDALSRKGILFRNFFANFEASEGGIVALLSGVPALHFPTASTNTFLEYSRQRAMPRTFVDSGYRTEFLTSVPMQFISMDMYARSPIVGFTAAAGQREIPRMFGAQRFAFESPPDHVLYEELLARLDARSTQPRQPMFMVLITASSHTPYVDPRGGANTESNVWSYVQDEFQWLHDELDKRRFFDNGLLIITGDHRKMLPLRSFERTRYGETAKARVPLLIVGAGAPRDQTDDRLFQQSDLLRMLDKALQPGVPLSPYVVWVERYSFAMGIASNAANVQIFDATRDGQRGFRLKMRGAELEWIDRPPNALGIERAIHRQRALQQATRAALGRAVPLEYGRELTPSTNHGVMVGVSADVSLSRDPDDPGGSLVTKSIPSLDLDRIFTSVDQRSRPFTLSARAFLSIPRDGEYWFSAFADDALCLAIDKQVVLGCMGGVNEGVAILKAGTHRFDVRFIQRGGDAILNLRWMPPGITEFAPFPEDALSLPSELVSR